MAASPMILAGASDRLKARTIKRTACTTRKMVTAIRRNRPSVFIVFEGVSLPCCEPCHNERPKTERQCQMPEPEGCNPKRRANLQMERGCGYLYNEAPPQTDELRTVWENSAHLSIFCERRIHPMRLSP